MCRKQNTEETRASCKETVWNTKGMQKRRAPAAEKEKNEAMQGYTYAVSVDLSKYFDTLNHELLMDLLHRQIQDMRVMSLIKKCLRSGVMENGIVCKTDEGSPLLANIYLNEFD